MRVKHIARLVAGIVAATALATGAQVKLAGAPAEAPEKPATTVADGGEYTMALPEGWTKRGSEHDGIGRIDTYRDGAGNYVRVLVFVAGSAYGRGFAADRAWGLRPTEDATGFTVAQQDLTCTPSELSDGCTAGNGTLEIYAMVRGGDGAVRGNVFQFELGNDRAEDVDTAVFERIVEGLRIK